LDYSFNYNNLEWFSPVTAINGKKLDPEASLAGHAEARGMKAPVK
jgi:hypothetical protein